MWWIPHWPSNLFQVYIHAEVYWLNQAVGLRMLWLQLLQRGRLWWDSVWACFAQAGIRAVNPSKWNNVAFPCRKRGRCGSFHSTDLACAVDVVLHFRFRRQARSCFRLACCGPESHVHRPSRSPLDLAAKGSPQPFFNLEGSRISGISACFATSLLSIFF